MVMASRKTNITKSLNKVTIKIRKDIYFCLKINNINQVFTGESNATINSKLNFKKSHSKKVKKKTKYIFTKLTVKCIET